MAGVTQKTLKILRKEKQLTQKEVARSIGATMRTYRRYEDGECDIPLGRILPLARTLGITIIDVLCACSELESVDAREVCDAIR